MNVNQKKNLLIEVAFWLFVLVVGYLLYKYILPIVLPFIAGLLVAYLVVWISNKLMKNNKWLRPIIIILFYGIFAFFVVLLLLGGLTWIANRVVLIPGFYQESIAPFIDTFYNETLYPMIKNIDPNIYSTLDQVWATLLDAINNVISLITNFIIDFVSNTVTKVPSLFISLLMMIISTFFFAIDYEKMINFYDEKVDIKWKAKVEAVKYYLTHTLLVVIRSYALIMMITFVELSVLFIIFGISNAFLIAIIIAIFDIMPVLGTGGILIPWSILSFVLGNPVMGIKIAIIYGIVTVVRNYVEPKIVGTQLGLHPIITLVSMFIGLRLFGFIGMFGLPVTISFLWKRHTDKVEEINA